MEIDNADTKLNCVKLGRIPLEMETDQKADRSINEKRSQSQTPTYITKPSIP
jgi:hypothetical protein